MSKLAEQPKPDPNHLVASETLYIELTTGKIFADNKGNGRIKIRAGAKIPLGLVQLVKDADGFSANPTQPPTGKKEEGGPPPPSSAAGDPLPALDDRRTAPKAKRGKPKKDE